MTGVELYENFKEQISQYTTDYVSAPFANYILNKSLLEQIEENYDKFATQENKDEIAGLIKTGAVRTPIGNAISLGYNPILSITAASATTYTVTFAYPLTLGVGITATLSGLTTVSNANGVFTYSLTNGLGLYTITSENVIVIGVSAASGTVSGEGIGSASNSITNYLHILAVKSTFEEYTGYTLTNATNASPIVITTTRFNNLRDSEKIKIASVLGNTNANGTHYIKKRKTTAAALYSNEKLTTAVSGNANYTSGGTITRVVEEYCKVLESDRKKTVSVPTISNPQFEISQKRVLVYPLNETCTEFKVDFLSTSPVDIDAEDDTTELNNYFNTTFLQKVINRGARIFKAIVDSPEEYQLIQAEIQANATS